jgi:hypothetical protein
MSIERIEARIIEFLKSDNPGVMSIKGAWGAGKTYAWERILKNQKEKLPFKDYSYVSLFGIETIDDFKFSIVANTINKSVVGEKLNWQSDASLSSAKAFLINGIGKFIKDIGTGHDKVVTSVGFRLLGDALICIDDFERNDGNLSAQSILGIVSLLKEKHASKVVLIFNDSELNEKEKEIYDLLKEKVVDYEIDFYLSPDEILEIIFDEKLQDEVVLREKLKPFIEQLGIKNLRILKRIKEFSKKVLSVLGKSYDEHLTYQAMQTSVLFVWSYYSKSLGTPNFEFIKGFNCFESALIDKDDNEKNEWGNLLNDYGFKSCDEFDLEIGLSVERGFVDKKNINHLAGQLNTQLKEGKSRESFYSIWKKFHRSFEGDKDSFSKELVQSFKDNVEVLNKSDLNGTVVLLRELKTAEDIDKLIDLFVSKHEEGNDIFDLSDCHPHEKISDKVIIEKFNEKFLISREVRELRDILIDVSQNHGITEYDKEVVFSSSASDFCSVFKDPGQGRLKDIVVGCLNFSKLEQDNANYQKAYASAVEALLQICKEDELHEVRIKRMGINLDHLKAR